MNKSKKRQYPLEPKRPVELHFENLDKKFLGNKLNYSIFLLFTFFGIMGLVWMIPFPQFEILKKFNAQTFLNWGSFYIAIIIYFYLKLAPTLSYAALFSIAIMSFFIVQLEYIERDGGPTVVLVCSIMALVGLLGLWLFAKKENQITGKDFWNLLTIGPIWLWSKVFDKLKFKY